MDAATISKKEHERLKKLAEREEFQKDLRKGLEDAENGVFGRY